MGAVCALTVGLTANGAAAPSQAAFDPGTGSATALVYKVNPVFGNLSFGITTGESVAGHQNTGATAQSKAVNLGVIGVTLAGEGCRGSRPTLPRENQPQPLIVSSDDPGAAEGKTADLLGLPGVIRMQARATKDPLAQATTSVVPLGDAGGVLIDNGRAIATSGIVKPGLREARAVTEIGRIDFFGGLVRLEGLRWEATQQTGAETVNEGTFTLAGISVAGSTIPMPPGGMDQLNALQDTLNALGFTITPPASRVEKGIVFVDPLRIGIVPSVLRDTIVGGVLSGAQPVREELVKLLTELGCESENNILGNNGKSVITILDLALGSISGAGALTLELGGVQATTSAISGFGGLGDLPPLPDLGGTTGGVDLGVGGDLPTGNLGSPDLGSSPQSSGAPTAVGGGGGGAVTTPIAEVDDGERGGILAGVGALGLALLLLTAEADRRKMRRAQREIPLEA